VGEYRTIVADPPWIYEDGFVSYHGGIDRVEKKLPYGAMTVDAISSLPVQEWAAENANLFLWTTNRYLHEAFHVMADWGFRFRQTLLWHKSGNPSPFGGVVAPVNPVEFLLFGQRGKTKMLDRLPSPVLVAPAVVSGHSQKPDSIIDAIERISPEPRLEMFARRARLIGWDYYGDESLETARVAFVEDDQ
jgi:N6-adenosine-specific RNA methylase IME4